ncbi:sugar transferase [Thaumasiovibrio sp. DFM-14]|uniref:sugar transferase n=1 Tax=Thaumasiovibrio sp. DFM-14 TaxID=3384792 RepID=UPI00399FABAA
MLYRIIDIVLALLGLVLLAPILLLVYLIGLFDTGSPLFLQQRVGKHQQPFILVKFRTMALETQSVATHLADHQSVTRFGAFLRKSKLDELPQLINVLKGEMSLVGPRPCLFNQNELVNLRQENGIFDVLPGITGLGQVEKVDMSTPKVLVSLEKKMLDELSLSAYFRYILQTVVGKGSGDRIKR